jgi:hypothetical protein
VLSAGNDVPLPCADEMGFFLALLPTAAGIAVVSTTAGVISGAERAAADGVTAFDAAIAVDPGVVSGVAPIGATALAIMLVVGMPRTAVVFAAALTVAAAFAVALAVAFAAAFAVAFAAAFVVAFVVAFTVADATFERSAAVFDAAVDLFLFCALLLCPDFAHAGWNKWKPKERGRRCQKLSVRASA